MASTSNVRCLQALVLYAILACLAMFGGAARAADLCIGDGQILLPSGQCFAGYYGYAHSNCLAVGNDALGVAVPSGRLTCVAGPSCPDGYQQGLPPPQNMVPGSPGMQPGGSAYEVSTSMCNAVCAPVFSKNGWPCSCPYGQKLDPQTGACGPVCGAGATWQHTPGYDHNTVGSSYLVADGGTCSCPAGQEYLGQSLGCADPCAPGQVRDGAGVCYVPIPSGGPKNICKSGQAAGSCQCPSGGLIKNGICIICALAGATGPGMPGQDPACKAASGGGNAGDGETPHGPIQPSGCLPGTHWNGLKCIANAPAVPACAAGTQWNGSACVSASGGDGYRPVLPGLIMRPRACPAGTHSNGLRCVSDTPATPTCASDLHWDGRTCVANGCSPRQHWDGRQCILN